MAEEAKGAGLMAGAVHLAETALQAARTRMELIGLELAEERQRVARLLVLGSIALLFFAVGLLSAVVLLAMLFWEQRLWLMGILALVFLVAGGALGAAFLRQAGRRQQPFENTVAELSEDIRQLKAAVRDGNAS